MANSYAKHAYANSYMHVATSLHAYANMHSTSVRRLLHSLDI